MRRPLTMDGAAAGSRILVKMSRSDAPRTRAESTSVRLTVCTPCTALVRIGNSAPMKMMNSMDIFKLLR